MNHELEQELESVAHESHELELENELENELAHESHEAAGEGEAELEFEFESEFENEQHELESHELEGESEWESEFEAGAHEFENELELENEYEFEGENGEQFFGRFRKAFRGIGNFVRRSLPSLSQIAKIAVPLVAKAVGGPFGAPLSGLIQQGISAIARESEHEQSAEMEAHEFESHEQELTEHEMAHELASHEAEAELMAHHAARASNELESEAMVGAATLATISARDRRALRRMIPHLVRGSVILTRLLRVRRSTRPMVRTVPTIVRRTISTLNRSAAAGQPITRRRAAITMARQTRRVLNSPRYCTAILRRNVKYARAGRPLVVSRRRI